MSATAERTRLEALREKEVELASERDAVMDRLAGYPAAIAAEREQSWYSNQKNRPLAKLNSKLSKLIDADAKDATALAGLNADLSAVRSLIEQEDAKVREQETKEVREQLKQLNLREEDVWERAGELFGELADTWNDYIAVAEESDKLAGESGIDAGILAVEPAPMSFRSFLLLLNTAATDPSVRAEPVEQQLTDIGVFGRRDEHGNDIGGAVYDVRPAGTRQVETRRKLDYGDRLFYLTPDLRGVIRAPQLSGHVPTIASE